jgi:hypothetical protein
MEIIVEHFINSTTWLSFKEENSSTWPGSTCPVSDRTKISPCPVVQCATPSQPWPPPPLDASCSRHRHCLRRRLWPLRIPWRPLAPSPLHSLSVPPPPGAHPAVSGLRRSGAPPRPRKAPMILSSPCFSKSKGKTLEISIFLLIGYWFVALLGCVCICVCV